MPGALILVVGPSGAGKDTLLGLAREALRGDPAYVFPRRLVTRPPSASEDNDELSEAAFAAGEAEGRFALSWRAHGLGYALPGSITALLTAHRVVCNVSRRTVAPARGRFRDVGVVEVTAPPDVLARRLLARGRAQDGDLGLRLARAVDVCADLTIRNAGAPADAARELVRFLTQWRPARRDAAREG